VARRQAALVADTSKDSRALNSSPFSSGPGLGGGAFVFPVIFESKTIGVLSFSSPRSREPDERLLQNDPRRRQTGRPVPAAQAGGSGAGGERGALPRDLRACRDRHRPRCARRPVPARQPAPVRDARHAEAELVGRSVKDWSHPDDRDVTDSERDRMRSGELPSARFEKRYFRKDGSMLWVALTVALGARRGGAPLHEISVLEEITERKEREAALQRFRTALDSSADMVFLFRVRDGALLDFNETVCTELGYTHDELLTLRPTDMRSDTTPESLRAEIADLLGSPERSNTVVSEYRRKDGSTFRWRAGAASSTRRRQGAGGQFTRPVRAAQRRERRATQAATRRRSRASARARSPSATPPSCSSRRYRACLRG